ncbi:MAG: hypothetical protein IPJ34_40825 [Myxococcales bacterium]|nr:hypothetical protein [Myxococcales bacterium]
MELSALAVANGERLLDNYRTELAASELVEQAAKTITSGPASWSSEDRERLNEALLAAISPTPSRRKA